MCLLEFDNSVSPVWNVECLLSERVDAVRKSSGKHYDAVIPGINSTPPISIDCARLITDPPPQLTEHSKNNHDQDLSPVPTRAPSPCIPRTPSPFTTTHA